MRISKVYTRTGDTGNTRLAGGQQVPKDHQRVEAYGTVDELNAVLGAACSFINNNNEERAKPARALDRGMDPRLVKFDEELRRIQNTLFDVGGILATVSGETFPNMPQVSDTDVKRLEELIDSLNAELEPLKEFLLPGGGKVASLLHVARTVCRRAERRCVTLSRAEPVPSTVLAYLNRLGDALFVLARWVSKTEGESERLWERPATSPKAEP